MAPFVLSRSASRVSAPAASTRMGVSRVPRVVVFAQEPRFTLENSSKAADGFVEKDTAGQSNMYPTVIKPFEAGSAADTVQQDSFNNSLAVGTSVVALGAIGLGLTALLNGGATSTPDAEDYSTYLALSAYSSKFSAELAPPISAPVVVAEVLPAPAVAEALPAPAVEEVLPVPVVEEVLPAPVVAE